MINRFFSLACPGLVMSKSQTGAVDLPRETQYVLLFAMRTGKPSRSYPNIHVTGFIVSALFLPLPYPDPALVPPKRLTTTQSYSHPTPRYAGPNQTPFPGPRAAHRGGGGEKNPPPPQKKKKKKNKTKKNPANRKRWRGSLTEYLQKLMKTGNTCWNRWWDNWPYLTTLGGRMSGGQSVLHQPEAGSEKTG